jgi:hypothetical protein
VICHRARFAVSVGVEVTSALEHGFDVPAIGVVIDAGPEATALIMIGCPAPPTPAVAPVAVRSAGAVVVVGGGSSGAGRSISGV